MADAGARLRLPGSVFIPLLGISRRRRWNRVL
jgi:hypothetical protein